MDRALPRTLSPGFLSASRPELWGRSGPSPTRGEGANRTYFEDGTVKVVGAYAGGLKDGERLTNYEDGKKNRSDVHRAGAGEVPFTVWRKDGSVWVKSTRVASQLTGDYTEW